MLRHEFAAVSRPVKARVTGGCVRQLRRAAGGVHRAPRPSGGHERGQRRLPSADTAGQGHRWRM